MPDYRIKNGDVVFVEDKDVDQFLSLNEGAVLIDPKPGKKLDPNAIVDGSKNTDSDLVKPSLESQPISKRDSIVAKIRKTESKITKSEEYSDFYKDERDVENLKKYKDQLAAFDSVEESLKVDMDQAMFNYETRTGMKPKSMFDLQDIDYKPRGPDGSILQERNEAGVIKSDFEKDVSGLEFNQDKRNKLLRNATSFATQQVEDVDGFDYEQGKAYINSKMKTFDEDAKKELEEKFKFNQNFELKWKASQQLKKDTGNTSNTTRSAADAASTGLARLAVQSVTGDWIFDAKTQTPTEIIDLNNGLEADIINSLSVRDLQKLAAGKMNLEDKEALINKYRIPKILEYRTKLKSEYDDFKIDQKNVYEDLKRQESSLIRGLNLIKNNKAATGYTSEQVAEYNKLKEQYDNLKITFKETSEVYEDKKKRLTTKTEVINAQWGVDISTMALKNNFKLTDDVDKFREAFAGDGLFNSFMDGVVGTGMQNILKLAAQGFVGLPVFATTGFNDAFTDDSQYSKFDAMRDTWTDFLNYNIVPESTDKKFNITDGKGTFDFQDGGTGFSPRAWFKTGISMIPFTAEIMRNVRQGRFTGTREALGKMMSNYTKTGVLTKSAAAMKNTIIASDAAFSMIILNNAQEAQKKGLSGIQADTYATTISLTEALVQAIMPDYRFLSGGVGKDLKNKFFTSLKGVTTARGLRAAGKTYTENILKELLEEEVNFGMNVFTDIAFGLGAIKQNDFIDQQKNLVAGTLMLSGSLGIGGVNNTMKNTKRQIFKGIYENLGSTDLYFKTLLENTVDPATIEQINTARVFARDIASVMDTAPENVSSDQIELLVDKKKLIEEKTKTDSSFHGPINEKIEAIDKKISESLISTTIDDTLETNLTAAGELSSKIGFKEKPQIFETTEEYLAAVKEAGFDGAEGSEGVFIGKGKIYIDKKRARDVQAVSVGTHEILHPILNSLVGDKKAQGELVSEFKNSLTDSQIKYVQEQLDANVAKEEHDTEFLNYFSDGIITGKIKYDDSFGGKIKDFFKRIFKKQGFENIDFKKGEDVFEFLKGYNKGAKKGKISDKTVGQIKAGEAKSKTKIAEVDLLENKPQSSKSQEYIDLTKEGVYTNEDLAVIVNSKTSKDVDKFGAIEAIVEVNWPVISKAIKFNPTGKIPMSSIKEAVTEQLQGIFPGRNKPLLSGFNKDSAKLNTYIGSVLGKRQAEILERAKEIGENKFEGESLDSEQAKQVAVEETSSKSSAPDVKPTIDPFKITPAIDEKQFIEAVSNNIKSKNVTDTKDLSYKKIGEVTPYKIVADAFGIPESRISNPKDNLRKSDGLTKIQMWVSKNAPTLKNLLPLGNVEIQKLSAVGKQRATTVGGESNKLPGNLVDAFYDKVLDSKGKHVKKRNALQYVIKPNISLTAFKLAFGVDKDGNIKDPRGPEAQAMKGLLEVYARNLTNRAARVIEDVNIDEGKQTESEGAIRKAEIARGKPKLMFARKNSQQDKLNSLVKEVNSKYDALAKTPKNTRIRKRILEEVIGNYLPINLALRPTNWTGGVKVSTAIKRNFDLISNVKSIEDPVLRKEAMDLIEEGFLLDLASIKTAAAKNETNFSDAEKKAFKAAFKGKKGKDYIKNLDNKEIHDKGVRLSILGELAIAEESIEAFAILREYLYHPSLNSNANRNQANATGVEKDIDGNVVKFGKGKVTDEHVFQAVEHARAKLTIFKNIIKNKKGSKLSLDNYIKWASENYIQFSLNNTTDVVKGDLTDAEGNVWKKSGGTSHPLLIKKLYEAIDSGLQKDWDQVPSSIIRYFNEYVALDPNNLYIGTESVAEIYKVNVDKKYRSNINVQELQAKLIYEIELTVAGELTDNKAVTKDSAAKAMKKYIKLAPSILMASRSNNDNLPNIIKYSKPITIQTGIDALAKTDKALANARRIDAPVKKIRVFDFDDTLARTKSNVLYTMPGENVAYNASPKTFDQLGKRTGLIFLATDIKEAQEYAKSNRGEVRTISVNDSSLATEDQVLDQMNSLNIDTSEGLLYEMIDSRFEDFYIGNANLNKLKKALKQNGFGGFKYNDGSQISSKGTESIAVIDKSIIKEPNKINAAEFAEKSEALTSEGAQFDFSEFSKVMDGKKGPLFEVAKIIADKRGTDDVFVLTARPANAAGPIQEFLKSIGLNVPLNNITGLGNGDPQAKAGWVVGKAAEGYNDFYFADDATGNVKAVKEALSVLDVKSKVQLAKIQASKNLDLDFNKIIENKTGIAAEKNYAKVKARLVGKDKGRFDIFIPPSAEDFVGLLYKTLGKGEIGDSQMKWYKKNLLDPYARAMESITRDRNTLGNNFRALKRELNVVPKNLKKKFPGSEFTKEQGVRVYIWNQIGQDIPGLSKADLKELTDIVENDPELKLFAQEVMKLNKGTEYAVPKDTWVTGTITTDLLETLNTTKRKEYLEQWQQNTDIIFSEKNLNKMEAAYGRPYRDAMENILARMKTGTNRTFGGDTLTGRFTDWLNGSTAAIMFFNTKSAVLQTISAVNFINFGDNNVLAAGKAFANQPQYWSDFKNLFNSDFLTERRDGLKINVNEADIADVAKESGARGVINKLLKVGFTPTQIADSFAIASGGATFYRNRIKSLMKEQAVDKELTKKNRKITYGNKYTIEQAEKIAMRDFREKAEESQQSSRPDRISSQQAGPLGRIVLAFANTPAQYARLIKKAASDLKNGRGSNKENISKILYYGVAQNLLFNALQQALFSISFGDDEEALEDKDKKSNKKRKDEKTINIVNGMADSLLRGAGIGGAIFSVVKNTAIKIYKESEKKNPKYEKAALELLKISPPVSSKVSKIMSAGRSFSWNMDEMKSTGFSLDNPAWLALGNTISAATNVPLDRVVKKLQHLKSASDAELETYKRLALAGGWSEWELGIEEPKKIKKIKKKRPGRTN